MRMLMLQEHAHSLDRGLRHPINGRPWYSGCASAFQADEVGSIPTGRSKEYDGFCGKSGAGKHAWHAQLRLASHGETWECEDPGRTRLPHKPSSSNLFAARCNGGQEVAANHRADAMPPAKRGTGMGGHSHWGSSSPQANARHGYAVGAAPR